jgi:succinate dehydrogenase / fumarate reductase, cytochrome b subunit
VLLASVLVHAATGTILFFENRAARPEGYAHSKTVKATIASRTMIYSGLIVAGFIVYHLLHLTLGRVGPAGFTMEEGNVYRNVVQGFQDPFISVLYIVGQLLLYFHLSHGIQSLFQSLGWKSAPCSRRIDLLGSILAFVVSAGNISMPLAVLVGLVK